MTRDKARRIHPPNTGLSWTAPLKKLGNFTKQLIKKIRYLLDEEFSFSVELNASVSVAIDPPRYCGGSNGS
ncbi:MAG: hypothetical protein NTY94_17160 [Alphaproteobacteria bacterium]|nr:hypothetical protein [Alphaproteobacteria bacterium]